MRVHGARVHQTLVSVPRSPPYQGIANTFV